jgi:hypothetical protein
LNIQNESGKWYKHDNISNVRGKHYFTPEGIETDFNFTRNTIPVDVHQNNQEIYVNLQKITVWETEPVKQLQNIDVTFTKKLNNITNWMCNSTKNVTKINEKLLTIHHMILS